MSLPTTPTEIIEYLKKDWGVTDTELANQIGCDKRSVSQAKRSDRMGIKDLIIVELIRNSEYLAAENERLKQYAPKPKQAESDPYIDAMNRREMERALG